MVSRCFTLHQTKDPFQFAKWILQTPQAHVMLEYSAKLTERTVQSSACISAASSIQLCFSITRQGRTKKCRFLLPIFVLMQQIPHNHITTNPTGFRLLKFKIRNYIKDFGMNTCFTKSTTSLPQQLPALHLVRKKWLFRCSDISLS